MKAFWKPLMILAVAGIFSQTANRALANDVDVEVGDKLRVYDGYGNLGGGIFEIQPIGGADFTSFESFCLQRTESIDTSSKGFIVADISDRTMGGTPDPLDPKTAWLYTQFRAGTAGLIDEVGYAFSGPNAGKSANALQSVIWHIEQEPGYSNLNSLPSAYRQLAKDLYAAATNAGWTNLGMVRVANLVYATSRNGHKKYDNAQDILILVPEPASIVFWSMSGAIGAVVYGFRRRRGSEAVA